MIHKFSSIPSSNQKGAPSRCIKWKVVIGKRVGQGLLTEEKKRVIFGPGQKENGKGFYHAV